MFPTSRYTPLLLSVLILNACSSSPSYEKRYDQISDPIRKEYQELAEQLGYDAYSYDFVLETHNGVLTVVPSDKAGQAPAAQPNAPQQFVLHVNYQGSDLAALDQAAIAKLDQAITPLRSQSNIKILVIGHANNRPLKSNALYSDNQALSEARAKVVADYVQKALNLTADAVTYRGAGDTQPIASNATAEGRNLNRRVELNIDSATLQETSQISTRLAPSAPLPPLNFEYDLWWERLAKEQLNTSSNPVRFSVEDLLLRATKNSNQIKVFSELPLIRQTSIQEAEGKFDTHAFVEGKYNDLDEALGSTLRTGRTTGRFEEQEWSVEAGARKPLTTGGEIELSQKIGTLKNNSDYLIPNPQANARLALTYRQPLLNGAGIEYNETTIEVAKVDQSISMDEFRRQVQAHLLEIERSYWSLYLERAVLLQKKRLLAEAESIVKELKSRDALRSQVINAEAVLTARRADSVRYEQSVRNAEAKLVSLVNDPTLIMKQDFELIPVTPPEKDFARANMSQSIKLALDKRPEINQAFKQLRAGVMRSSMSENEVLPVLNLVLGTYLDGLAEGKNTGNAIDDEYNEGKPSFTAGLLFDMPLGNNVAKAREQRRRLEVRQLVNQLRTTIDTVFLEVQVATREVDTAYRDLSSKYQAMLASHAKRETLQERRDLLSSAEQTNYLQNLLDAQQELAGSEEGFLTAYITYNIAQANLRRAEGVLLEVKKLEAVETEEDTYYGDKLPTLKIQPQTEKQ
ncbi:TolC family protein [Beggiatoa leptomitoformis]|uniref:OmpA family protein n=1 Tax=Beggiatoa leptomitoformis TaxID=288004 RepID=A0A2N9YH70_9GAMM|nr:TolC family protein [Beggiatoa leptomitoformis]ALG67908.1 OmpA family protein [Beggiatoa leptomitoformis]AUI69824.1 OmpA family protein [Beggiatoa leptomitoformis]